MTALGLKIPPRDLKSTDTRALLTSIYSQWLPLSSCVAQAVIDVVPPPAVAQITRLPKMLSLDGHTPLNSTEAAKTRSFMFRIGSELCLLAYVSKMFAVPEQYFSEKLKRRGMTQLQSNHRTAADASANPGKNSSVISAGSLDHEPSDRPKEDDEVLLGFARLYSGTIRTGDRVFCVLPKYQNSLGPEHPSNVPHVATATVEGLYIMMGRELLPVDSVKAGNIFAIRGLEGKVWRSATLCEAIFETSGSPPDLVNLGRVKQAVRDFTSDFFPR